MSGRLVFKRLTYLLTAVCLVCNLYIYTYPSLNGKECSWKCQKEEKKKRSSNAIVSYFSDVLGTHSDSNPGDIKLIAFGDPQIKGVWPSTPYISRLDTFGNDYYLGHIFDMMYHRLKPTHVAAMGDLFSSQWIGDSEFFNRMVRYTKRLFKRDVKWLKDIEKESHAEDGTYKVDWVSWADNLNTVREAGRPMGFDFGYENVYNWTEADDYLFINVTGNHDIGSVSYTHLDVYKRQTLYPLYCRFLSTREASFL